MLYCKANSNSIQSLKEIFSVCFEESIENTNVYFENLLDYKFCYVALENNIVCASLYLIPSTICIINKNYKSNYLFAAGTLPSYRKKGIMQNLINYSLEEAFKNGDKFSALLPADKTLYNYYSKFGFVKSYKCKVATICYQDLCIDMLTKTPIFIEDKTIFDNMCVLRFNIINKYNGSMNFDSNYLYAVDKIFNLYGGKVIAFDIGYVAYYKIKNEVFIQEVICREKDLKTLLFNVFKLLNIKKCTVRVATSYNNNLLKNSEILDFGMIKILDDSINLDIEKTFLNAYLGLTLD